MTRVTKISLAALAILVIAGIGVWFFLRSGTNDPGSSSTGVFHFFSGGGNTNGTSSGGTAANNESFSNPRLTQVVKTPILGATLTANGLGLLYFARQGGNLFQADLLGGNPAKLSNLTIVGMTRAAWSPKREAAAISYVDGDTTKHFVDFIATSSPAIFLPSDVSSFLWGADGTLYYTESGPAGTKLVSSKAGKTPKTLFLDVVPDFRITGINQSGVMLVTAPSSQSNGIGELISSTGKGSVIFSGAGLAVLPSPKSTFLASALDSDGRLTNIGLFNAKGDLTRSFNVVTLPEKCAWVGTATSVYCAVPENISGSLPEDWFQGKVGFHDRIVKIATETGIISEVLPQTSFDVVDIFLDPQEQYLFFRNKSDSSLWRLELPK